MSKASEWAKARPVEFVVGEQYRFCVDDYDGGLMICENKGETISQTAALELARWILDTFGDS